jgi:SAM-dependent methyltransferase
MSHTLGYAAHSVILRASVAYHSRCLARYWNSAVATHADMDAARFDFYADAIAKLLGAPQTTALVLDHGAGRGEIGTRLAARGYRVEFSELSTGFVAEMRSQHLVCYYPDEIPSARYDVVFANNSLLYVHPRRLVAEIAALLRAVKPGGRLLILDVPVLQRMGQLPAGQLKRIWWRFTRVVQPEACGFFIDQRQVCRAFPQAGVSDSWSSYRVHFEIAR